MSEKNDKKKKEKNKPIGRKRILKFLGDTFRFIVWFCYFIKAFGLNLYCFNIDSYISELFLHKWKAISIVLLCLTLIISIEKKSFWKGFGLSVWYIIRFLWRLVIFPVRLVILIVKLFKKTLDLIGKIINLPSRIEIQILSAILFVVSIVIIIGSRIELALYSSMFLMFWFMFIAWQRLYIWTKNPYGFAYRLEAIFNKIWNFFENKLILDELKSKDEKKPKPMNKLSAKRFLWYGIRFLNWFQERWSPGVDKRALLKNFFIFLFIVVSITITSFSFGFFTLQKLNPGSIQGISDNIWEFFYFSTITFFNFDIGNYVPQSLGARILIVFELLSVLFLLTVSVLTFTTMSVEGATKTINDMLLNIEKKKEKLLNILNEHFQLDETKLLTYTEQDFKREESELRVSKNKSKVLFQNSDELEKRMMIFKSTSSWAEAEPNLRSLLKFEGQFRDEDILKIVDIVLDNPQIFHSFAARALLKEFINKNVKIIPKEKLQKFLDEWQ